MSGMRSQLPRAGELTGEGAEALGGSGGEVLVVQVLHSLSRRILHASWGQDCHHDRVA